MGEMIPHNPPIDQMPHYRLPPRFVPAFAWGVATLRSRSFAQDANLALTGLHPELDIRGKEHIPPEGPCLVTCNHYSRPGFAAWWLAFSISAAVAAQRLPTADPEIHWVITGAWTFPDSRWKHRFLTPISRWVLDRVARMYGFVSMPPMPPDPGEVGSRARAVRQTLRLARQAARDGDMIGLAPEGRDVGPGLGEPPRGAGVFIGLLVQAGLPVLPVGISEQDGRLRLSFGPTYEPSVPHTPLGTGGVGPAARALRDRVVSQQVMDAIARQLHEA